LGFLEFTDVNYVIGENPPVENDNLCFMLFKSLNDIYLSTTLSYDFNFSKENFASALNHIRDEYGLSVKIVLIMNSSMSFQDYITIKSVILAYDNITFDNEFIY
jgi:hypothetical protein